ncbi:tripartite tricarboxylate transporter substrate binding protein [Lentibacter algarum]|uniref:tripartite tricarboxylate transporter substrate binding protein n=1 Tax=Lentibacter algarum TaxID=576131 RepID=UPI001C0A5E1B|nr:tripartite tricarboxylate transporter substrate binding protein [Lentibacter algarum]MBU2983701.1 tripartite tricarboxylate transporter substrate binding protein [Lentibacter algarum]
MKSLCKFVVGLGVALGAPSFALAEGYPEKPVSFVVPWAPGDLEDLLTRMIAEEFQNEYGVAAAVVNKPSGGGGPFPGAAEVAKAPADGYTVGSFVSGVPLVGPYVGIPELTPDPFDAIGIFLTYPFVIAAAKDAPYSNMEELAAYSQENKIVLGHYGNFLLPTKVTKAHAQRAGIRYYTDAAYDVLDCNSIRSGDVDVMNTTIPAILPCLDKIQVLAAITEERTSYAPDAPTIGEVYPDLTLTLWNGLFVHKDTPQDVRDKIAVVAERVMAGEAAQKLAADTGAGVYWQDAETSLARILKDGETSAQVDEALKE